MTRLGNLRLRLGMVALALAATAWAAPAVAQSSWEINRGNCNEVLSNPTTYSLSDVRGCVQRWEAYGSADAISDQEAQAYARGFSRLYHQGNSSDQNMARSALTRLGLDVIAREQVVPDERMAEFLARDRSPIRTEPASERARQRARDRNRDGMQAYNRGDYEAAADEFVSALEADPYFDLAKYNLICQLALLGRTDDAIEHLDELSRWDSPEVAERMSRALVDEDLISLRDDPRFRIITGQARVQLLNGGGDAQAARIQEIHDALVGQGLDIASYGYDRWPRARPMVWYRTGFEDVANQIQGVLASDQTRSRPLDWPSEYDVVVVWGAVDAGNVPRPRVHGLLRVDGGDPEEAVDDVADSGEDAVDLIQNPEDAPDTAVDAVQEWMPD